MSFDLSKWKVNNKIDRALNEHRGNIVTRFSPEPSGSLHIGHCKAIFINYLIARKYDGKFLLRIDDTNPETESEEFEKGILEDIKTLGVVPDSISRSSDHFEFLLSMADKLVDAGLAFVDNTSPENMGKEREMMQDSINRDNSIEINQVLWVKMKTGEKTDSVLRIKIDMKSPNGSLRDPTIYRSVDKPHQHTKDRFKVYPTYDFTCPIVDSIEGVTHVYRSVEFSERDDQYRIILEKLGLRTARLYSFGKVIFQKEVTSKRKIKAMISAGEVEGWDDPRLLTVKGAFKRGMSLDGLIDFTSSMGFSKNMVSMTTDKLWNLNKLYIDKIASRYTAFPKNNTVEFTINYNGFEKKESTDIVVFKRAVNPVTRKLYYNDKVYLWTVDLQSVVDGEEVTLMNWGNAIIDLANRVLILKLYGNFKKTKNKLLWLPTNRVMEVTILNYKKPGKPRTEKTYLGEDQMANIKKGEHVQLYKLKFYRCDSIDPLTFITTT